MNPCCKTHIGPIWVAHIGPILLPILGPYGSHILCLLGSYDIGFLTFLHIIPMCFCRNFLYHVITTGKLWYVKLAYLENPTCVEVIVHSRTFPLYFIVFRPCLCRTRLWRKLGCIEVIFHSREKFSISFTTGCVEVKMCTVIGSLMQKHFLVIIPNRQ